MAVGTARGLAWGRRAAPSANSLCRLMAQNEAHTHLGTSGCGSWANQSFSNQRTIQGAAFMPQGRLEREEMRSLLKIILLTLNYPFSEQFFWDFCGTLFIQQLLIEKFLWGLTVEAAVTISFRT